MSWKNLDNPQSSNAPVEEPEQVERDIITLKKEGSRNTGAKPGLVIDNSGFGE